MCSFLLLVLGIVLLLLLGGSEYEHEQEGRSCRESSSFRDSVAGKLTTFPAAMFGVAQRIQKRHTARGELCLQT
jgi:hypothetical protein